MYDARLDATKQLNLVLAKVAKVELLCGMHTDNIHTGLLPWLVAMSAAALRAVLHTHLGFCCSAILISATNVDAVVATAAAVAGIYVSTQHTANNVAQVWHIVDVRQGTGDQDVSGACSMHSMVVGALI